MVVADPKPGANPSRHDAEPGPSKSKHGQANPNKVAWICLVLFVRIGTYQWVTAIPNKNFPPFASSLGAPSFLTSAYDVGLVPILARELPKIAPYG
jgi:hypothetical protein